jgi:3-deoxy-D-manno-octulosonic-acid transferase
MLLADGSLSHTKLNFLTKLFYKQIYSELNTICAILKEDEDIFKTLVSTQTKILVTGDTRYDQVYRRLMKVKKEGFKTKELFPQEAKIIVAGSTWQKDEEIVLATYKTLIKEFKDLILILVPHEPKIHRLVQIDNMASKLGISWISWSTLEKIGKIAKIRLIIVDKIGILANLYQLGDVTYVGGSFGHGVHNCLEPAVMGKPVFFGPKIDNSYEAKLLVKRGAGFIITNAHKMSIKMAQLLANTELLTKSGNAAFELVKENLGATEKIITEIEKFILLSGKKLNSCQN